MDDPKLSHIEVVTDHGTPNGTTRFLLNGVDVSHFVTSVETRVAVGEINRAVAQLVATKGMGIDIEGEATFLAPAGFCCTQCGSTEMRRETD